MRVTSALRGICAVLLFVGACGGTTGGPVETADSLELFNPRLGPAYSQWLIGPIYHLATPEEVEAFGKLPDDEAAKAFVEDFWQKRSGRVPGSLQTLRGAFESRVEQADRQYSEGGYVGHRTDRGTIFVIFGEPEEVTFENATMDDLTTVEVWSYPDDASAGLDGKQPDSRYRFYDTGDLTVFYRGQGDRRRRNPITQQ